MSAEQTLVERGPYRVVRHPGYGGSMLVWIGAGCATANGAVTCAIAIVAAAAYAYRMQIEEALLARQLGAAYRAYQRRSWKLVPGVY